MKTKSKGPSSLWHQFVRVGKPRIDERGDAGFPEVLDGLAVPALVDVDRVELPTGLRERQAIQMPDRPVDVPISRAACSHPSRRFVQRLPSDSGTFMSRQPLRVRSRKPVTRASRLPGPAALWPPSATSPTPHTAMAMSAALNKLSRHPSFTTYPRCK